MKEEELEIKISVEEAPHEIEENTNLKENITDTIKEEQNPEDKKITSTIIVEEINSEDKDGNKEEIKLKKVDEIPQNMDYTNEIENLESKNIKFAVETEKEKKCNNPGDICNNICLIF